jgi:hypothetical protein
MKDLNMNIIYKMSTEYASSVVGGIGEQHANPQLGNAIAQNLPASSSQFQLKGGKRRSRRRGRSRRRCRSKRRRQNGGN